LVETHSVSVEAEWAVENGSSRNTSLYTSVSYDESDDTTAKFGVRYYFGQKEKSLIRRHREDDPSQSTILWALEQAIGDLDSIINQYREFHGT
jgi:hypothetical protein